MVVKSSGSGVGGQNRETSRPGEIVVFWIRRDSACAECGEELGKGRFLHLESGRPLCLACADLDHLVFLARGDAALTRRAGRYSTLKAVVVRFSRTRKSYERQGCSWRRKRSPARSRNACRTRKPVSSPGSAPPNGVRISMPST